MNRHSSLTNFLTRFSRCWIMHAVESDNFHDLIFKYPSSNFFSLIDSIFKQPCLLIFTWKDLTFKESIVWKIKFKSFDNQTVEFGDFHLNQCYIQASGSDNFTRDYASFTHLIFSWNNWPARLALCRDTIFTRNNLTLKQSSFIIFSENFKHLILIFSLEINRFSNSRIWLFSLKPIRLLSRWY